MNKEVKRYLIMIIGAMIIGVGAAFIVGGNIGGDSMTTFEQGLMKTLNISLPIAMILANAIFVVLLLIFSRENISIDTVLCPLFISLGSNFAVKLVPSVDQMFIRIIFLLVGIVICALGIGVGAQTSTGSNPYDGFVLAFSKKINQSYSIIRPIFDVGMLILGILLHGTFGVGTFIATFCIGPVANVFIKGLSKMRK